MVFGDTRADVVTASTSTASTSWVGRLAAQLHDAYRGEVPGPILDRAALHLLDSIACAAGAVDAEPVTATRRAVAGSGPGVATVLFGAAKASTVDAVLVNGTAVRFLDANDIFLGSGPGGHPSDNVVVALAAGEESGASGRDVLTAIALSYDLVSRIRTLLYRPSRHAHDWHEVSISGTVAAAMAGLLYGLDKDQLAQAIAIGAAKGYALKEIRRGEISAMKACGNALVARDGVLAAQLARAGLTGPMQVFEGESGLFNAIGLEPDESTLAALTAEPEWAISRASIKAFPGLGTSQAAVNAAARLNAAHGPLHATSVRRIGIRLADSAYTRDYRNLGERLRPTTRETADHSIQFLVAVALLDGWVTPDHYESQAWLAPRVTDLMAKTEIIADPELNSHADTVFPAIVEVETITGETHRQVVRDTPGSPQAPWSREDIVAKFGRFQRPGHVHDIEAIADAALGLSEADDLSALMPLLR